ncbi:MAG: c-type cytochrome [Bacteroidetes bacterium]|nr:c-type cytochrome [Bacteroidota bacterium]
MKNPISYTRLAAGTLILSGLMPLQAVAQDAAAKAEPTIFSNSLFNAMLVVSILLVALIFALASVLKNLAGSDYLMNKLTQRFTGGEESNGPGAGKIGGLILVFCLLGTQAFSQDAAPAKPDDWLIGGLDYFTFFFMLTLIFLELIVIALMIGTMKYLLRDPAHVAAAKKAAKPKEKTIMDKLNASVDIEKEGEIMLDHNYDGIRELDNNLPPWWKYGFYFTILVAVVYLIHFHVIKTGDLQTAEYDKEMAAAKAELAEHMKNAANNVDENTVKLLTDPAEIAAGKKVFDDNCVTCHRKDAGGQIGPNLTDDYWLHGGSIQDIFKSIKYGWTDNGMKSWKDELSPVQISELASFIKSIRGSNPASAKAPQGDLYTEGTAAPSDSTKSGADSLQVTLPADSLKK